MKPLRAMAFATAVLTAPLLPASASAQDKAGDPFTPVTVAESFSAAKPLAELKDGVVLTPRLYRTVFFGKTAIWAGAFAANPTKDTVSCSYYVALFDKDKRLIGAASQDSDVEAGAKDLQLASCLVKLSDDDIKRVAFAQWRLVVHKK